MALPAQVPEVQVQLTDEDRVFVSLLEQGFTKSEAYVNAYPNDKTLKKHLDIIQNAENQLQNENYGSCKYYNELMRERSKAVQRIGSLARDRCRTQKIRLAFHHFTRRMEDLAVDALDVAYEIMNNGRSEKVRADLATRMIEHHIGSPTQKVLSQSQNEITITIGDAPADTRDSKQIALDKARMQAGLSKKDYNEHIKKSHREEPQEGMVIDIEDIS